LISLAYSVTLLPALVTVIPARFDRKPAAVFPPPPAWLRRPLVVIPIAAILAVVSLITLPRVGFDGDPIHLRDPETESVQTLRDLAADGTAPLYDLVALAGDRATAERWAREVAALPEVRRAITIDSLVPADQDEKLLVLEDIALVMGPDFAALGQQPPDGEALRAELSELRSTLSARDAVDGAEHALLDAVTALLADLEARGGDGGNLERLRALDADLTAGLERALARLATGLTAAPFERADLPPELAARYINAAGQELVEIAPAENVAERDAAERFVASVRTVVANATGLPVVYEEAAATVVRSFQLAFAYAFAMVLVLLFLFLRRGDDVVLVLLPIVFASIVTAAATVWLGIPFNFANIITLPLLVGIGVDNGIHLVHRMRTEPPEHGDPLATSTSRAVVACALTTIASFGSLAFSPHLGMASMGQVLTLGMTITLLTTLLLTPAMLQARIRA
jgi:hopanoid biosynthesis associated RND transporter like protein HpnN